MPNKFFNCSGAAVPIAIPVVASEEFVSKDVPIKKVTSYIVRRLADDHIFSKIIEKNHIF